MPSGAERGWGWLLPIRCLRSTGISLMGVAHAPADVVVLRPASCVAGPVKAGFGIGALFRRGRDQSVSARLGALGKEPVGLRDEEHVSAGFRISRGSRDLQRFPPSSLKQPSPGIHVVDGQQDDDDQKDLAEFPQQPIEESWLHWSPSNAEFANSTRASNGPI
jgi:hypothetical protein